MSDADPAPDDARALPLPPAVNDRTADLEALHDGADLDTDLINRRLDRIAPDSQDVRFLVVPGYLTYFLAGPHAPGLVDHFGGQITALREAGMDVSEIDVETETTVENNAAVIREAVLADDRTVCLIYHSKGENDTLEFLIQADPDTRKQVMCWIALQGPFAGSPIADGWRIRVCCAGRRRPAWITQRPCSPIPSPNRPTVRL